MLELALQPPVHPRFFSFTGPPAGAIPTPWPASYPAPTTPPSSPESTSPSSDDDDAIGERIEEEVFVVAAGAGIPIMGVSTERAVLVARSCSAGGEVVSALEPVVDWAQVEEDALN